MNKLYYNAAGLHYPIFLADETIKARDDIDNKFGRLFSLFDQ